MKTVVGSPSSSSSSKRKLKPKTREDGTNQINVIDHISDDTMFEIFTHLSLKQNFQLKLLSKKWMPDAFDDLDRGINQEKGFATMVQQYRDGAGDKMNPFAEQEAWEDHQIGKATLQYVR